MGIQPGHERFHNFTPQAFSLMLRIDGDIDDFKIQRTVADDPPHAYRCALPKDMNAVAATWQADFGRRKRASRQASYFAQAAEVFSRWSGFNQRVFSCHGGGLFNKKRGLLTSLAEGEGLVRHERKENQN